jgi:hypothetical protein
VDPAVLRAFARRDWSALQEHKERYWIERKRTMTPADALGVGDALRRHARALHGDWPDADERAADIAVHVRVAEALGAVARITGR